METLPQPPTGPVTPDVPVAPPGRRPKRRWLRAVLLVSTGVAALLCLGGVGIGFLLYDRATEPDRSAPDVAVSNYLRALLVERDDARVTVFECGSSSGLSAIRDLRSEIEAQEQRLDTSISVTWGELLVREDGETAASVTTSLRRTAAVDGATQSLVDQWRFRVTKEAEWRVCEAEKIP